MRVNLLLLYCFCLLPLLPRAQQKKSALNDTISLQEVSVSVTRERPVSGMMSGDITISIDKLPALPSISGTVDVLKLLELTPSITTSGDGNSNIHVRGGDAGQNLILYGGVTTYTPGHALSIFPLFNADHLQSIKLSKGTADVNHGNFLSSVIDVQTKSKVPPNFQIKGNVGILASQATLNIPLSKSWGAYLSLRKTYLNQTLKPLLKNLGSSSMGYDFWDGNFTLVGRFDEQNTLYINSLMGTDQMHIDDTQTGLRGKIEWQNRVLSLRLESAFSDRVKLTQQAYYSGFTNNLQSDQEKFIMGLQSNIQEITYKNSASFRAGRKVFDTGFTYSYFKLKPHDLHMENTGVSLLSVSEDKVSADYFAGFASGLFPLGDKLSIKPMLRYNFFSSAQSSDTTTQKFQSLDARLTIRYQLSPQVYLRANYAHNNQYIHKLTPSSVGLPTDFWVAAGAGIKPQYGDEFSIGGYHCFNEDNFELSGDVFYRTMHDATLFEYNFIASENVPFTDKIQYGQGRSYGVELMLKKNFGRLTGWISYALAKSERQFAGVNDSRYFPARFDRRHDLSATMSYKIIDRWELSLTQIYATGNMFTQPSSWYFMNGLPIKEYTAYNNSRLPDYNRTDLGVSYWFSPNNGLNFSLYNLFFVVNPIYVFLSIEKENEMTDPNMKVKFNTLYRLIPSISWNFKF